MGRVVGPMHGLPVSLKDQFHVKEVETTMGYVGWIGTFEGRKGTESERKIQSQLVDELLEAGAVLYCKVRRSSLRAKKKPADWSKTSLPQPLLLGETINNIIGSTINPLNQRLSCGGSSGGEGALQALGGSSIGVGSDIGTGIFKLDRAYAYNVD